MARTTSIKGRRRRKKRFTGTSMIAVAIHNEGSTCAIAREPRSGSRKPATNNPRPARRRASWRWSTRA